MRLFQLKNGYRYNSDSVFLWDFAMKFAPKGEVLDVGAGCGILGLLLKYSAPKINLSLLDIQEINCEISRKNSAENGLNCDIICENFLDFKSDKKFDFIISNPPFYHDGVSESQNLHINISRYAKNLDFGEFALKVASVLKPRGVFVFCYESAEIMRVIESLQKAKFSVCKMRFVHSKSSKASKLVLIMARLNSRSKCEILPPLVGYDDIGQTSEILEIFDRANLTSIDME